MATALVLITLITPIVIAVGFAHRRCEPFIDRLLGGERPEDES